MILWSDLPNLFRLVGIRRKESDVERSKARI